MEGQISLNDYTSDLTHDRRGKLHKAAEWMNRERCENCKYWEILSVELQSPAGWGVKGQCNCSHEPETMKHGYWQTGKTSYCQDYESRW